MYEQLTVLSFHCRKREQNRQNNFSSKYTACYSPNVHYRLMLHNFENIAIIIMFDVPLCVKYLYWKYSAMLLLYFAARTIYQNGILRTDRICSSTSISRKRPTAAVVWICHIVFSRKKIPCTRFFPNIHVKQIIVSCVQNRGKKSRVYGQILDIWL